ncbi:UDP-glucuronic acid decarboxylase 1 [Labeo rohita]|uniref:UDP-glucuronic acid decarboxylase 1 n=1 Tax=Labeo rohita TaxID=84645 RepID=UPI0021E31EEA|nr:UDP-glucuronic acid decarboxylase 1 [Labeo rohita]
MMRMSWMITVINRRMMKILIALALIAYIASVWGTYANMRSIQEHGEMKIEQRIDEAVAPLREKIRELELSFTQKYPPVKFLSEKDRKRILITGGAGFVGSHLTDKLMMDGHEVTVVDNFFTGRKRNVEHWIGHENFELINHDVVEPLYIEVDQIYHLASPASPPNYMYNPIKTLKTNTIGTLNMLGLAKRVGARLLLASTSEVYGDPEVHPQNEDYWGHVNPIGPRACYDEGKRVAETMCYAYMKQEGVEVRVARIFNTFGSRMHMNDGRVVSNFILQALQGEPLTVYGSGSQTRAFQYVSDLVNGLVSLMNSNISSPVNLGNPEEHTILEFAQLIKSLVVSRSHIQFLPEAQDDPQRRRPDIRKAKMLLGWEPVVPLEEGLNKTIQYFSRELEHQANNQYIPKPKAARMKKRKTPTQLMNCVHLRDAGIMRDLRRPAAILQRGLPTSHLQIHLFEKKKGFFLMCFASVFEKQLRQRAVSKEFVFQSNVPQRYPIYRLCLALWFVSRLSVI